MGEGEGIQRTKAKKPNYEEEGRSHSGLTDVVMKENKDYSVWEGERKKH